MKLNLKLLTGKNVSKLKLDGIKIFVRNKYRQMEFIRLQYQIKKKIFKIFKVSKYQSCKR